MHDARDGRAAEKEGCAATMAHIFSNPPSYGLGRTLVSGFFPSALATAASSPPPAPEYRRDPVGIGVVDRPLSPDWAAR